MESSILTWLIEFRTDRGYILQGFGGWQIKTHSATAHLRSAFLIDVPRFALSFFLLSYR